MMSFTPTNATTIRPERDVAIQLLDASLLEERRLVRECAYWQQVLARPNGWHYDADHAWILRRLEALRLPAGATILDAGAGQGILQYLLASRGFNVISLDFSPRRVPARVERLFTVVGDGSRPIDYTHQYMAQIHYERPRRGRPLARAALRRLLLAPGHIVRKVRSALYYAWQRGTGHSEGYGTITFLRAPFHDIPLGSATVDAVVSVSALEHGDRTLLPRGLGELRRVTKAGGVVLLTTSASRETGDTFHEETAGWCFSRTTLEELVGASVSHFDIKAAEQSFLASRTFRSRIDPYYFTDEASHFYRRRFVSLPYLPVGIAIS